MLDGIRHQNALRFLISYFHAAQEGSSKAYGNHRQEMTTLEPSTEHSKLIHIGNPHNSRTTYRQIQLLSEQTKEGMEDNPPGDRNVDSRTSEKHIGYHGTATASWSIANHHNDLKSGIV
jgi:hypothetical protein